MAYLEEIIVTETSKGTGKDVTSIVRKVTEYYAKDGTLLAANDPCGNFSLEAMIAFAEFIKGLESSTKSDVATCLEASRSYYKSL